VGQDPGVDWAVGRIHLGSSAAAYWGCASLNHRKTKRVGGSVVVLNSFLTASDLAKGLLDELDLGLLLTRFQLAIRIL
jgi:hypothetical protein